MAATAKKRTVKQAPFPEVMNLAEAARFLRLTPKVVTDLVANQGLPARKIGREWRFLRSAVERWLQPDAAHGSSILAQAGIFKDDPDFEAFQKEVQRVRQRWNEEVA